MGHGLRLSANRGLGRAYNQRATGLIMDALVSSMGGRNLSEVWHPRPLEFGTEQTVIDHSEKQGEASG